MHYAVNYVQHPTGWNAHVPDLGVFAAADTREEIESLVSEAVEFHLEELRKHGDPVPEPATEVAYVEAA